MPSRPRRALTPAAAPLEPRALLATLTVGDYGAAANDAADDAPAIQAALDSAQPGDTVLIPAGEFSLAHGLVMARDGVTLAGVGPASVLRLTAEARESAISLPAKFGQPYDFTRLVDGVTIRDLTLDGNKNPEFTPGTLDYYAVFASQASDLTLSGLTVKDWSSDGISIGNGYRASERVTIEDNLISGNRRNGIHVGFALDVTIAGNRITDTPSQYWGGSAASGIDIEVEGYDQYDDDGDGTHYPYVRHVLIEDNVIERSGTRTSGAGVAIQPAYGAASDITIRGNLIAGHQRSVETSGDLDLYGEVAGVHGIVIEDNSFTSGVDFGVQGYPVLLDGVADVTVRGNTANDSSGIYFLGPFAHVLGSKDVAISDNTVLSNSRTDNRIADLGDHSDGVAITGNFLQAGAGGRWADTDGTVTNLDVSDNEFLPGPWDGTAPTVRFEGAIPDEPVTVTATDEGSGVARVFWYVDGVPAGFDDAAPFAFSLDPLLYVPGPHEIKALAVDHAANYRMSEGLTVVVGDPPAEPPVEPPPPPVDPPPPPPVEPPPPPAEPPPPPPVEPPPPVVDPPKPPKPEKPPKDRPGKPPKVKEVVAIVRGLVADHPQLAPLLDLLGRLKVSR